MIPRYSVLASACALFALTVTANAQTPGTTDGAAHKASGIESLDVEAVESGFITWSVDGCGSNNATCTTNVDKPVGATVRKAYMAAANVYGYPPIADGRISINGTAVNWDKTVVNGAWDNSWADVTAIVKPIVDAAAAGIVPLTIGESVSITIDGSLVVVIFDDPNVTTIATVALMFGGQAISGDTFSLGLADPFDNATQDIVMSLGISFSYRPSTQYSLVEVNGTRLTTDAGGFDDGEAANGALFTVGGLGDDPSNPADPNATDQVSSLTDDELYTINPLLSNGESNISVFTRNPSNDDNILFAGFLIRGTAAVVGEGITLGPTDATNPVGTNHTVTARVQNTDGDPVSGLRVDFEIVSGPHAGLTGGDVTDADGEADFTWTGVFEGTDVVVATATGSQQQSLVSNEARKTWVLDDTGPVCEDPSWDGSVVENGGSLFLPVSVPGGLVEAELYNTRNLLAQGVFDSAFNDITADFTVTGVGGEVTYTYVGAGTGPEFVNLKVAAANPTSSSAFFLRIQNDCTTIDVDPVLNLAVADRFALNGNYPNPFTGETTISFDVVRDGNVTVAVYDMLGQLVRTLAATDLEAGRHEVTWDGTTASGSSVASGIYLYRVTSGDQSQTRHMTLIR